MRCDVESSEVFHIIDSINIQLGPNWQPSTTKMAVAQLNSFIIVIMIFKYYSNIFSTRYKFCVFEILSQADFLVWLKTDQGRMRCDVESSKVFHIIDSINIQLGPNWQPPTTKLAVSRLRCDADSLEVFHIINTII